MTRAFVILALLACRVATAYPSHPAVLDAATPIAPLSNQYTIEPVNVENHPTPTSAQLASVPPQAFSFQVNCTNVDDHTCRKVNATIPKAIEILERTLIIEKTIHMSFTFEENAPHLLAVSTIWPIYPVRDDDDIIRLYPRPLAKQFVSLGEDSFADVNIAINPKKQWYFPCDEKPLKENDILFLHVVLHEIVHGLGFITGWTPFGPRPLLGDKDVFMGFAELPFDRYLYKTATNESLSNRVASLNKVFDQYKGTTVTEADMLAMTSLPIHREHTKDVENLLTTPGSVAFRLPNGDSMILETSRYPYVQGCTLMHADISTYAGTDNDLMIYSQTTEHMIGMTFPEYPVLGPKTTAVLEVLGYKTHQNPNSQKHLKFLNDEDLMKLLGPSNVKKLDQQLPPSHVPAMDRQGR